MKKIYLIDSENVNDAWVELLPVLEGGDRITVFYTDKSPHMCYQHVIALLEKEREIRFIKCFEGNNALDFQLVSELGYMLCEMPDYEYVIVSNDTGFDAIVKYWEKRGRHMRRRYRTHRPSVGTDDTCPRLEGRGYVLCDYAQHLRMSARI